MQAKATLEDQVESSNQPGSTKPKVVIIGGGFGGLSAAKALAGKPVDVTLIDRTNHHLFQPLLYQVATAGLSPSDIAQPIRHILREGENISVLSFLHQTAAPLPGVAPVAMQMGRHAARNILALAEGRKTRRFHYFDKGNLATIGRNRAVADLRGIRFGGVVAWLSWLFIHLIFLVGLRNRLLVFFQWVWAYFTYARGARLIYGAFRPNSLPPAAGSNNSGVGHDAER